MGYKVFVSHSGKDYDLVRSIQDAATPLGVTIYTYEQDLQPGCSLPQKLLNNIESSNAMIVLLTKDGSVSPAVNQEIGVAKRAGKLIVPIIDDGVDPMSFPMLQGCEFLTLNRANPSDTLLKLMPRLATLKSNSDWGILVLIVIGALFLLFGRSE
jgi:hypothetical protein